MIKNFIDYSQITGHLQIAKKFKSGEEEIIFDDHNIIVDGMGLGLSYLFALSGSGRISDFQIDRFQVGLSGAAALEVSSTLALAAPLSTVSQYGDTDLVAVSATHLQGGAEVLNQVFVRIPFHNITRIDDTSVRYTLILDEDAANSLPSELNEVGLFMKNPRGDTNDASVLVAYRVFSDVSKTSDFALIFRWTINW